MDYGRANLKRKWVGLNPSCPEFVPRQPCYGNIQPFQTSQPAVGWVPRGQTTWQYDVSTNQLVGGYYPRIRTKGAYLYDLDAVPFDPNVDVPIKVCFNCWQQGHPQQKCNQPETHTFCDNCGRINVTVNKCPRCARAYNRFLLEEQARKKIEIHNSDENLEKKGLEEGFEMENSVKKNGEPGQNSSFTSVANQTEEGYFSNDGSEYFDDIIFDENISSYEGTSDFLRDFMILMDVVKNLPVETQNEIVQQFLIERRMQLKEQDKEKDV